MKKSSDASAAIGNICRRLGLPPADAFTQDWAYELSDEFRSADWLQKYISSFDSDQFGQFEKQILMDLILDAANTVFQKSPNNTEKFWPKISELLLQNYEEYSGQIEYWSAEDYPIEDSFFITSLIRKIKRL